MSGRVLSDSEARLRALDVHTSFIVQAPAGSGKTSLLISRYICLLETVDEPEEILAVTFTNKATHEMRSRILNALDPNANVDLNSDIANAALARVRARSEQRGWDLERQPSRLQIMTIDALCAKVVRYMPWASRFGMAPQVAVREKLAEMYRVAAQNTILLKEIDDPAIHESMKLVLKKFDNTPYKVEEVFIQMLGNRDQWLKCVKWIQDMGLEARDVLEQSLLRSIKRQIDWLIDRFSEELLVEIERLAEFALSNLVVSNNNELKESLDAIVQHGLSRSDDANCAGAVAAWRGAAEFMMTQQGDVRGAVDKRIGFPSDFRDKKERFGRVLAILREQRELHAPLHRMRLMPNPEYDDADWESLKAILDLLPYLVAQLHLEFRRQGAVDFIEVARQAALALGTPQAPTDLNLVLDYRIKHMLVDEFQDTSRSQEELLHRLTGGWQPQDGRTLFVVGDPMQSIYRFREAEVGVYLHALEKGLGSVPLEPLILHENFRSNESLVDWFNKVFKTAFPQTNEADTGSVKYSGSQSRRPGEEGEKVHMRLNVQRHSDGRNDPGTPADYRKEARVNSAGYLVRDIRSFLARAPQGAKALILLRQRSGFAQIRPLLEQAGIEYYGSDLESLKDRQAVQDVLSLTRALSDLGDRASWLAILRAPWCGIELADMLTIAEGDCIWESMNDGQRFAELSEPGQMRVARVRTIVRQAFEARGRLDFRQLVEDTWTLLGGPACVTGADVVNAGIVLDLIESHSDGTGVRFLDRFETFLADLYAVPDADPEKARVHVMTIHGAKGLEFDAVFIPGLERVGRHSDRPLIVWEEPYGESASLLLSPVADLHSEQKNAIYEYVKSLRRSKDEQELVRLAYVACTRAKDELYLYGTVTQKLRDNVQGRMPPKGSVLEKFWKPFIEAKILYEMAPFIPVSVQMAGKEPQESDLVENVVIQEPALVRLPADWKPPAPHPSLEFASKGMESPHSRDEIDFDWAGDVARWVGIVVHEWLQKISVRGIEQWSGEMLRREQPQWKMRLRMLGVESDRVDQAAGRVADLLKNVLDDERARWLLSGNHRQAHSEWRLTAASDGDFRNFILDRSFVDDADTRWIVDYKTGYTDGDVEKFLDEERKRYSDQLQQYGELVSQIDRRPIRLGLYFPSHRGWREWAFEPA